MEILYKWHDHEQTKLGGNLSSFMPVGLRMPAVPRFHTKKCQEKQLLYIASKYIKQWKVNTTEFTPNSIAAKYITGKSSEM